ncbi:MAG: hypothetical protein M3N54_15555, partial [Acidobacteriota bacterium]|nr:hypothetical protein [Acidobacteriota bacterium]
NAPADPARKPDAADGRYRDAMRYGPRASIFVRRAALLDSKADAALIDWYIREAFRDHELAANAHREYGMQLLVSDRNSLARKEFHAALQFDNAPYDTRLGEVAAIAGEAAASSAAGDSAARARARAAIEPEVQELLAEETWSNNSSFLYGKLGIALYGLQMYDAALCALDKAHLRALREPVWIEDIGNVYMDRAAEKGANSGLDLAEAKKQFQAAAEIYRQLRQQKAVDDITRKIAGIP